MIAALLLLLQVPGEILDGLRAEDPAARDRASAALRALDPSEAGRLEAGAAGEGPEVAARLREAAEHLRWKGRFSARARARFPGLIDLLRRGSPADLASLYDAVDAELARGGLETREAVPIWIEGVSDARSGPVPFVDVMRHGSVRRTLTVDEMARRRLFAVFGNAYRGDRSAWRAWWGPLAGEPERSWHMADLRSESGALRSWAVGRLAARGHVTLALRLRFEILRLSSGHRRGLAPDFEAWPILARRFVLEPLRTDPDPVVRQEAARALEAP